MGTGATTGVKDSMAKVLRPYAVAAVSVTVALLLTLLITPPHQPVRLLLFVLAVVLSANEGVWPGLFATGLSAILAAYFLIPPTEWAAASESGYLTRMLQFCGLSLAITWVTHRFQHSRDRIRTAEAVIESLAESIMRQDLDNSIQSWNKAAERIYGYTAEEAIGRPVSLIVPPDRRDELQQLVERVHLGGSVQSHETVRIRKDGTRLDVALTLSPIKDRKGRIVGVSSIAREITERKQAEEAIRQSHADLERQTEHLRILAEMSEMLQASSVPSDAYAVIARCAQTLIPASSGALFVYSASRDALEVAFRWGETQPNEPDFLSADECWGLRTGRVHVVASSPSGLLCRHLPDPPPACYLCAPMIALGETLGLLHLRVSRPDRNAPDAELPSSLDAIWAVRPMAERLALTLADMKLREALRAQSICDPLTGWYNRRHMEETLERDIRRAARSRRPLSLLMVDIDNFKEFNDTFGHEAGDVTLQNLCQMMKTLIRGEDVACRYGGDEFVIILPDSSAELAAQRAEDMRIAAGHAEMQYQGRLLKPMKLSFGISSFPSDGKTSHELLRAADSALYRAKSEGRDRVRLHGKVTDPKARS
jgi:diguanylate cyclase (GGDEF)-like protein/PAS domain S-box-containing protein